MLWVQVLPFTWVAFVSRSLSGLVPVRPCAEQSVCITVHLTMMCVGRGGAALYRDISVSSSWWVLAYLCEEEAGKLLLWLQPPGLYSWCCTRCMLRKVVPANDLVLSQCRREGSLALYCSAAATHPCTCPPIPSSMRSSSGPSWSGESALQGSVSLC